MKYNTTGITAVVDVDLSPSNLEEIINKDKTTFVSNNFSLIDIDEKTMLLELKGENNTLISIKFFK